MGQYKLPIDYNSIDQYQRREVKEQYIQQQNNICMYCKESLNKEAPKWIKDKKINWNLFPKNFLQYRIHLQHNHKTGMTEGVVHNYCNAVMWQYEGK